MLPMVPLGLAPDKVIAFSVVEEDFAAQTARKALARLTPAWRR